MPLYLPRVLAMAAALAWIGTFAAYSDNGWFYVAGSILFVIAVIKFSNANRAYWLLICLPAIFCLYAQFRKPTADRLDLCRYVGRTAVFQAEVLETIEQKQFQRIILIVRPFQLCFPRRGRLAGKSEVIVKGLQQSKFSVGDYVEIKGRIVEPTEPKDAWRFKQKTRLAQASIFCIALARSTDISPLPGDSRCQNVISNWISLSRQRITDLHASSLGNRYGPLLESIVLGNKCVELPGELVDKYRRVGLSHLLAASGFNLTIIIVVAHALTKSITRSRRIRTLAALVPIAVFVALAGLSPSVVRAAACSLIILIAIQSGRSLNAAAVLSLVLGVMLLIDPSSAMDVGAQLSYAATFGILYGARPLSGFLGMPVVKLQNSLPAGTGNELKWVWRCHAPTTRRQDDGFKTRQVQRDRFKTEQAQHDGFKMGQVQHDRFKTEQVQHSGFKMEQVQHDGFKTGQVQHDRFKMGQVQHDGCKTGVVTECTTAKFVRIQAQRTILALAHWMVDAVAVVVSAQSAVIPIQLGCFWRLGIMFLPASVLVDPLVAPITVIGFASSTLILASQSLHGICRQLDYMALVPLKILDSIAGYFAAIEGASVNYGPPSALAIAVYYTALILFTISLNERRFRTLAAMALLAGEIALFWRPPLTAPIVSVSRGSVVFVGTDRKAVAIGSDNVLPDKFLAYHGAQLIAKLAGNRETAGTSFFLADHQLRLQVIFLKISQLQALIDNPSPTQLLPFDRTNNKTQRITSVLAIVSDRLLAIHHPFGDQRPNPFFIREPQFGPAALQHICRLYGADYILLVSSHKQRRSSAYKPKHPASLTSPAINQLASPGALQFRILCQRGTQACLYRLERP